MFYIVTFIKTNEVAVVPTNWVRDNTCVWPPKHLKNQILKLIPRGVLASDAWPTYDVDIMGRFGSYAEARSKVPIAEERSDLKSTDQENCGKGMRNKYKPRTYSSSSTESEDLVSNVKRSCIPQKQQKNAGHKQSVNYLKFLEEPPVFASKQKDSEKDFSQKGICEYSLTLSTQDIEIFDIDGFEASILRDIKVIKTNQANIMAQLHTIITYINMQQQKEKDKSNVCSVTKSLMDLIPVQSMQELQNLEYKLKDENISKQMIKIFK